MTQPECETQCAYEGGSMLCISSLEENDGVFSSFVEPGKCEDDPVTIHDSWQVLGFEVGPQAISRRLTGRPHSTLSLLVACGSD